MKKLFSKKVVFDVLIVLFALVSVTSLVETIVCFWQAPGECEESWFLYLAHNRVCENFSFVPLYFNLLPSCLLDYLPCRMFLTVVKYLVSLVLILSLVQYCRCVLDIDISMWRRFALYALPLITASSQGVNQADYVSSVIIFVSLALSLLFFALSCEGLKHFVFVFFAGFLISHVLTIRPPMALLVALMALVFLLHGFRQLILFCLGVVVGLLSFVFVVSSPAEFLTATRGFLSSSEQTTDGHGARLILTTSVQAFRYLVPCLVTGMMLRFVEQVQFKKLLVKRILLALTVAYLALHSYYSLRSGINLLAGRRIDLMCALTLFFYCAADIMRLCENKQIYTIGLLVCVPVTMGIGTTTPFDCTGSLYCTFLIAFAGIVLHKNSSMSVLLLSLLMLAVYQASMVDHLRREKGSCGQRFIDSTQRLQGVNLKATPSYCEYIQEVDLLTTNRAIIAGGPSQWVLVKLLHKQPLSTSFRLPSDCVVDLIRKARPSKDNFMLFEDENESFDDSQIAKIGKSLQATGHEKINLYRKKSMYIFK